MSNIENEEFNCAAIVFGYCRPHTTSHNILLPDDVINICVSYYQYLHKCISLKLVYCDDKTGDINTNNFSIIPFPLTYTLKEISNHIERELYFNGNDPILPPQWPLTHIWLKYGQIKYIYPNNRHEIFIDKLNEDENRWVEVPDDYLNTILISNIDWAKEGNDIIVIEKKQDNNKWSRAKGDNWRETIQIGDIIDHLDNVHKWYESLVRYIFPKGHENEGNIVIHDIGWSTRYDEIIEINAKNLVKRNTNTKGSFRRSKMQIHTHHPYLDVVKCKFIV
eukprot:182815_1